MSGNDEDGMSARDRETGLRVLAQRAEILKTIATSANVLPFTIAASYCRDALQEVDEVIAAIDLALATGSANANQRENVAANLRRIATTLDAALFMGGFNAPCARSVDEWRNALTAILVS
jgi:hypothetical protein